VGGHSRHRPRAGGFPVNQLRTHRHRTAVLAEPENRCLVVSTLRKYALEPNRKTKKKDVVWFRAQHEQTTDRLRRHLDRVTGYEAPIKTDPRPQLVYGFPDDLAERLWSSRSSKAMPVILTPKRSSDVGCVRHGMQAKRVHVPLPERAQDRRARGGDKEDRVHLERNAQ